MDEWIVSIDLDPAEVPALESVLSRVIPAEKFDVLTGGWEAGPEEASLSITVAAEDAESAYEAAGEHYARARKAASLPKDPARVVGYVTPIFTGELYNRLHVEASYLLAQGRYALAVVRVQTAVEVYVRLAFKDLLLRRGGAPLSNKLLERSTPSLTAESARGVFFLLTGWRPEDESWWPAYLQHAKRRNGIVHEGLAVTREQARASLEVAARLHAFVETAWADAV